MSTNLTVNGTSYAYPATGDQNWGTAASNWAAAVTSGMLQKAGGAFTLTADVNFGTNFGLIAQYFTSANANPAGTGIHRLANTDGINWRNAGNSADLSLAVNASNALQFNSINLADISSTQTLTNKTIAAGSNTITGLTNSNLSGSAAITYANLSLAGSILNSDLAGSIAYSKLSLSGAIQNSDLAGAVSVLKGGTGSTSVVSTPAATAWAGWDANKNLSANNLLEGYTTTATSASSTSLLVGSSFQQIFTGSTTQTVLMPVTSTLTLGQQFQIINLSSGVVTVQSSGANTIQAMAANTILTLTCILTSGTTAASWTWSYQAVQNSLAGGGTVTSVTFTGDGTVLSSTPSSAVTTSGTVTASLNTQTKNTFLAGPTTGAAANPTFRVFKPADFTAPTQQVFTSTGTQTGWVFTVTSANATAAATYTNNGNTYTVQGTISAGTTLFMSGTGATSGGTLTKSTGSGDATITFSSKVASATYTPAANVLYLRARLVGGGGGAAGSGGGGGSSGGSGGNTLFGANLLVANGGVGGTFQGAGGTGGTSSLGSGPTGTAISGGSGNGAALTAAVTAAYGFGNAGAASPFGGAGGGPNAGAVGTSAAANSGSGGGGAGPGNAAGAYSGASGGAGGFVDALISGSTLSGLGNSIPYVIAAAGTAGNAGATGQNGGAGGTGYLEITELYQ